MPLPTSDLLFFAARYALLLFAFVVLGVAYGRSRRAAARDAERLFEQMDIAISRLNVLEESLADAHARLEERLQSLQSQTSAAAAVANAAPAPRQYETAIRLARAGSAHGELMASCGVTRHEAELLVRLHAPRTAATAISVTKPAAEGDLQRAARAARPAASGAAASAA